MNLISVLIGAMLGAFVMVQAQLLVARLVIQSHNIRHICRLDAALESMVRYVNQQTAAPVILTHNCIAWRSKQHGLEGILYRPQHHDVTWFAMRDIAVRPCVLIDSIDEFVLTKDGACITIFIRSANARAKSYVRLRDL